MKLATALLSFAVLALHSLAAPAGDALGERVWDEVIAAKGGIDKVGVLVRHKEALHRRTLDREAGLQLADAILAGFPWREQYVDSEHQQDLFKLRDLAVENGLRVLDWLWVRFTEHHHPYVRLHGIQRLGEMEAKEHARRMAECLADSDFRVRMGAAGAILTVKAGEHAEAVEALLADPDEKVRVHAVIVLTDLSGRAMIGPIAKLLRDPSAKVRARAATALDELGAKGALVELRSVRGVETAKYVAEVLDSSIRSLEAQSGPARAVPVAARYSGPNSQYGEKRYMRVDDRATWRALWSRHVGDADAAPATDFAKHVVVAIFQGKKWNSRGVTAEITEDDRIVRVRFDDLSYQTKGGADEVTPFGFFVIPKTTKPLVLEENTQGYIGYEPIWRERVRLRAQ